MVNLDKSKQKIEGMFDEIAPTYDKLNHLFTMKLDLKWRKEIVNFLLKKNVKADVVLDLASGTGDLTKELLKLKASAIHSADISERMLDVQREKIRDERVRLIRAEAESLPFEPGSIDIITIGFGIRNFENMEKSLKEMKRVLKPGGKLIILEMFSSKGLKNKLFSLYFGRVMPFVGNKISKSKYAYNYLYESVRNFYGIDDFLEICSRNGFNQEFRKDNFLGMVYTVYLTSETDTKESGLF